MRAVFFYPKRGDIMKIKISQDFREADLTLRKKDDRHSQPYHAEPGISIHALRVEGDPSEACGALGNDISIHALRAEGDRRAA